MHWLVNSCGLLGIIYSPLVPGGNGVPPAQLEKGDASSSSKALPVRGLLVLTLSLSSCLMSLGLTFFMLKIGIIISILLL